MPEQWVFPDSELVRVIDGDTFTARVHREHDAGFHIHVRSESVQRFRLNRIACAPLGTPSGDGAALQVQVLLSRPFTLTSVGPYKYGDEWMAEVVTAGGNQFNDLLITSQWAAPWNGRGPQPLPPWPRTI